MSQGMGKKGSFGNMGKSGEKVGLKRVGGSRGDSQRVPFIHYLRKYLLSIYHVPGRTLNTKGRESGIEISLP